MSAAAAPARRGGWNMEEGKNVGMRGAGQGRRVEAPARAGGSSQIRRDGMDGLCNVLADFVAEYM